MRHSLTFMTLLLGMSTSCLSQITITFTVDMSGQVITPEGVHIAGQFAQDNAISITQDWQPGAPGSKLTLVSGSTYSIQVIFPSSSAGKKLEFEFVRSDIWSSYEDFSEGNPGDPNAHLDNSCGVPDGTGGYNRIISIPACGGQFSAIFNYCGTLSSQPGPSLTVSSDAGICPGKSVQLSATSNGSIAWLPSDGLTCSACNDPVASPATSTLYTVSSTSNGCTAIDSVLVTVDTARVSAGPDQYIAVGASTQLQASGSSSYSWGPATGLSCTQCSSPVASPAVTTSYTVTATSTSGCESSDTVTIFVSKNPCEIFFPNAFTPNGDGINDKFGPLFPSSFIPPVEAFRVYNRWGEMVFETKDLAHKWDGKFHGVAQGIGTYVYYVMLNCNGRKVIRKGLVALLR